MCVHDRCRSAVLSVFCLGFNLNCQVLGCYPLVRCDNKIFEKESVISLIKYHLEKGCREGIIVYMVYSFVVLISISKSWYFKRMWADQLHLTVFNCFFLLLEPDRLNAISVGFSSIREKEQCLKTDTETVCELTLWENKLNLNSSRGFFLMTVWFDIWKTSF